MKTTILLCILGVCIVSAGNVWSQGANISVHFKEITVRQAMSEIELNSDYVFVWTNDIDAETSKIVNIDVEKATIEQLLDILVDGTQLSYRILDKQIVVFLDLTKKLHASSAVINGLEPEQAGRRIKGTVSDQSGEPVAGATIRIKGTTSGTATDADGNFTLNVEDNAILQISYVGYVSQEIIVGSKSQFDIVLQENISAIDEITVTALGLKREKKALGYAVQDVKGDDIARSRELDVVNALSGHVAGVQITHGGGGLNGGGSRIVIRGENSMSGNNTPLFVIDGVPGGSGDVAGDDIESISVLKGPAASALYGSRALAGVILITTKSGKQHSGLTVEVNSNSMWQNPLVLPEYQTDYGQGQGGKYEFNNSQAWGANLNGTGHDNIIRDFYETGYILTNNASVTKASDLGSIRLSYTNITQKGMIPNTDLTNNRFDINTTWELFRNFKVNANVKFIKKNSSNDQDPDPYRWPASVDLNDLKDYWEIPGEKQKIFRYETDNPYFALYENLHPWESERWFTNVSADYSFLNNFTAMVRASYISESGDNKWYVSPGSEGFDNGHPRSDGGFSTNMWRGKELNMDFLLSYENRFANEDIFLKASFGGNSAYQSWNNNIYGKTYQLLDGVPIYTLGNYQTYPRVTSNYGPDKRINSLYAFVNLGYKNMLYLDITGRNDWSSTLPPDNNSYFYPSVSLSGILTEMLELPSYISFWKVRTSYASVGNDTGAGQLQPDFYFTEGTGGIAGISEGGIKREYNLKPELASSFEVGTDIRLFDNRLELDVNYYNTVTRNQIWNVQVSNISGYNYAMKNAGKVSSHGMEVSLNADVVKSKTFTWHTGINWSFDRSYIDELDPENPDLVFTVKLAEGMYTHDKLGERRGALYSRYAKKFVYDPAVHSPDLAAYDGAIIHDQAKKIQRSEELAVLGNYNPDWIGSWNNSLRWNGFTLSALLTCNYGNDFFALKEKEYYRYGFAPQTGIDRNNGGVLPVNELWDDPVNGIHPFRPGDEIDPETYWKEHIGDGENNDYWIRDGSYVKLKEANLAYDFPTSLLRKSFIKGLTLSLIGRDLAVWSKVKWVDPEIYGYDDEGKGIKIPGASKGGGVPSARSVGFSVNVKF
ncbi:MAG: SusC/RagA family TonB-linked outer membrane protein [Tannerella sp.]|nr:SusC/RagA family TonB-linked outer membrane protein [Tannerella sp.]